MKKKKRERGNPLKQGGTILLNNPKKNGNRTFSTNVFFLKFLPSKDQKKKNQEITFWCYRKTNCWEWYGSGCSLITVRRNSGMVLVRRFSSRNDNEPQIKSLKSRGRKRMLPAFPSWYHWLHTTFHIRSSH